MRSKSFLTVFGRYFAPWMLRIRPYDLFNLDADPGPGHEHFFNIY